MKYLFATFMLFHSASFAGEIQLNDVRLMFEKSVIDETTCRNLIADLNKYNEANNTTFAAYKACATMIMAKHCFNPFKKLSYFNEGKLLLEKCISSQPENTEARYLRLTVQSSAPRFLCYNKSLQEDKDFLQSHYSNISDELLKIMIYSFLLSSEYLTYSEKLNLKS